MIHSGHAAILVLVMAAVTWALRFLPFLIFRKKTPEILIYLGDILPAAIIGMLVIYCLRDVNISTAPYGLPEWIGAGSVVVLQWLKRKSLISILGGTILYMVLVNAVFI